MTQKERQERSRALILQAALNEFGSLGYDAVTMDRICAEHKISKGMMYHYFSSKDDLFLFCVNQIVNELNAYVAQESKVLMEQPPLEAVRSFFLLRETFFQSRSREKHIFENALLYPPRHLAEQITRIRGPLRETNNEFIRHFISHISLRSGIEKEQAHRYLDSVYSVFWAILEHYHSRNTVTDLHSMLTESAQILNMLLFGIADADDTNQK